MVQMKDVVRQRSKLVDEIKDYLKSVIRKCASLPRYFPEHLRSEGERGKAFVGLRQRVRVVEDRSALARQLAEQNEALRAMGQDVDGVAYEPKGWGDRDEDPLDRDRERVEPMDWDDAAMKKKEFSRVVILGDPGFGKTWLLKHEAVGTARDGLERLERFRTGIAEIVLPVFIRLAVLAEKVKTGDRIEKVLLETIVEERSQRFRTWAKDTLASERGLVLLDAWDEVPVENQPRLRNALTAFSESCRDTRVYLTSRVVGYDPNDDLLRRPVKEVELVSFEWENIEAFAGQWFGRETDAAQDFLGRVRNNLAVRGQLKIPLLLTLMCRFFSDESSDLPTRRCELYEKVLQKLLTDWYNEDDRREAIEPETADLLLEMLSDVAMDFSLAERDQFPRSDLYKAMRRWTKDNPDDAKELLDGQTVKVLLQKVILPSGLLVKAGDGVDAPVLFLHRTFHEYLTAWALARRANKDGWAYADVDVPGISTKMKVRVVIDRKSWSPRWRQTIVLLAGLLDDPMPLLNTLADEVADDLSRRHMITASSCIPDLRESTPVIEWVTIFFERAWPVWCSSALSFDCFGPLFSLLSGPFSKIPDRVSERLLRAMKTAMRQSEGPGTSGEELGEFLDEGRASFDSSYLTETISQSLRRLHGESAFIPGVDRGFIEASWRRFRGELPTAVAIVKPLLASSDAGEDIRQARNHIVGDLLAALRESDTRMSAIEALERLGVHAARTDVVSSLMDFVCFAPFSHNDHTVLWDTQALGFFRRRPGGRINNTVEWAAQALGKLRTARIGAELIDQPMVKMLDDEDPGVWSRGILLLESSSSTPFESGVVDRLTQLVMESESWEVRASVARRLGRAVDCEGRDGIVLVLRDVLEKDMNEHVRFAAGGSLARLGDAAASEVIPVLVQYLENPRERAPQVFVAEAVGAMGSIAATPEVISVLVMCLHTDDLPLVQTQAAYVIGRMGNAAAIPEVIAALIECIEDPMPPISALSRLFSAIRALEKLADSPATLEAMPALLRVYSHGWEARDRARKAIGIIWGDRVPQDTIRSLLDDARDVENVGRAAWAIRLLRELKWSAVPPELVHLLLDEMRTKDGGRWPAEEVLRLSTEEDAITQAIGVLTCDVTSKHGPDFFGWRLRDVAARWVIQPGTERFCRLMDVVDLTKNEEWREFTLPQNSGQEGI